MKNFKKLIAVVVMAAVCCVMAGPTVVSAEESSVYAICPPHQLTEVLVSSEVIYFHYHGVEVDGELQECRVTTYSNEYNIFCTVCNYAYVEGRNVQTHSICD